MANVVEYALKVNDTKAKKALNDTAKAAKKAAKDTKQFGKTAGVAMDNATKAAKGQRKSLMSLRRDTANLDRLSGELAVGLSAVNSEFGAGARMASNFAGALEGGVRALLVQNKTLLAVTITVAALSAAYNFFAGRSKEAEEKQKKLDEQIARSTTNIKNHINEINKLSTSFEGLETLEQQANVTDRILKLQKIELLNKRNGNKEREIAAKAEIKRLEIEQKVNKGVQERLNLNKAMLENATKRGNLALKTIQDIEKIRKAGGTINEVDEKRLKNAKEIAEQAKKERKQRQKIISDFDPTKGVTQDSELQIFENNLRSDLQSIEVLNAQLEKKERAEAKAQEQRKKANESRKKALKIANDALKPLEKEASKLKQMIAGQEKANDSLKKASIDELKSKALLLKQESQLLGFKEKEQKIKQANFLLDQASKLQNDQKLNKLQNEIDLLSQQREAANLLLATMEKEEETIINNLKTEQERINFANKLNNLRESIYEQDFLRSERIATLQDTISKENTNNIIKQDLTDEQRHQNKLKRISAEQTKRKKAAEIVNNTNIKLQEIFNDTEQKRIDIIAQKRKEAIEKVLSGITSFVDNIVSPAGLVQQATSAIGNVFGELGGMVGSAVGGIIGGIARLGEKTPEEIQQEMTGFLEAFEKGMEMLPDLIVRILPQFAIAIAKGVILAIPMLIKGIGDYLVELGVFIIEGMRQFFEKPQKYINEKSEQEFSRMSKIFDKYFGISFENQAQIKQAFSFRSGGRILSARSGMRVTSGAFGAAQMAMVHPGEIITPQSGSRPQAIDRTLNQMSGGQGVTVVINSAVTEANAIDGLVRKIENRFRTFGSATSPLFG